MGRRKAYEDLILKMWLCESLHIPDKPLKNFRESALVISEIEFAVLFTNATIIVNYR
jgi:hypothetical protein